MIMTFAGTAVDPAVFDWRFARATGPGGQHVNKTSSAAELRVQVARLPIPADAKQRLLRLAGSRATVRDEIVITAQSQRSQWRNRAEALNRLEALVRRAMERPKPRVKTKPLRAAVARRLDNKKRIGLRKRARQRPALSCAE